MILIILSAHLIYNTFLFKCNIILIIYLLLMYLVCIFDVKHSGQLWMWHSTQ